MSINCLTGLVSNDECIISSALLSGGLKEVKNEGNMLFLAPLSDPPVEGLHSSSIGLIILQTLEISSSPPQRDPDPAV